MITDALAARFQDPTNSLMLTCKGRLINPLDPQEVDTEEIAHVLSRFRRYGGHTPISWTVGQHVILCAHLAYLKTGDEAVALQALHHDDQEAIIGDWPKPIKNRIPGLKEIEDEVEAKVRTLLGLPTEFDPVVKEVDLWALEIESYFLWAGQLDDGAEYAETVRDLAALTDDEVKTLLIAEDKRLRALVTQNAK